MRNTLAVATILLIGMLPTRAQEEDPWLGKTRAQVLEVLGQPGKAIKIRGGRERLRYTFYRIDTEARAPLDVRRIFVPGIGVVGVRTPTGSMDLLGRPVRPRETDEFGSPVGGSSTATDGMTVPDDVDDGEGKKSDPSGGRFRGKVKLKLVLDEEGRVGDWSVSGRK